MKYILCLLSLSVPASAFAPTQLLNSVSCSSFQPCYTSSLFLTDDSINFDKEINIDDVLLEAELALQVADDSLAKKDIQPQKYYSAVKAITSTIGGALFGIMMGYLSLYEIHDLDLIVSSQVPPAFLSLLFGGIGCYNGFVDNKIGKLFGSPVKATFEYFGSLIKLSLGKAATSVTNKAESIIDEIVELPSRVAADTKTKVISFTDEMKDSFQDMVAMVTSKESLIILSLALLIVLAVLIDPSSFNFIGAPSHVS
jgi:hypothetical protein